MTVSASLSNGDVSMPSSNKAAIYSKPGTLQTEVIELPIPEPGHGEVLVRLLYSGVCHTDVGFCMNHFPGLPAPTPAGQIGGHEGVGRVVAHGPGVDSPAIGSHVGIKYAAYACLSCDHCIQGGESSCKSSKISGYYTPGTFQQYCVSPANYVTPIPEGLDLASTAPLMCGGITVYTALKTAGVRVGDWVAISGAGGGLGHLAIQYAKYMGGKVLAIDSGNKQKLCHSLGADEFVDFTKFTVDADMASEIKSLTNGGARIALMCASSAKSYSQAMSWVGFRGTIACLGIPEQDGSLVPSIMDMVTHELRVIATKSGNRLDAKECLEIAAQGAIKTHHQIRTMDHLSEIFEDLEHGRVEGRVVLDLR